MAKELAKTGMTDDEVVAFIEGCYTEAKDAKRYRLNRNKRNNEAMLGQQDWSYKQEGQSTEFLPKTAIAVEQFAAFIKRGMVQAGPDWFEFIPPLNDDPNASLLNPREMRLLLSNELDNCLLEDNVVGEFHTCVTDAIKLAATESLAIFKVHGQESPTVALGSSPRREMAWRLRFDVIPFEAYFVDPTGKKLYEIHVTERDLYEVQQRVAEGVYDAAAVKKLAESCRIDEEERRKAEQKGESESDPGAYRKKVVIKEFWGTLLKPDGSLAARNVFCAIANERHLIRKPEAFPYWHGESPFVVAPLIRIPKSTQHKALFDEAVDLNLAMNEVFNLFLDGGMASVWGVRQLRQDFLADNNQVSDGIAQGATLVVNSTLPPGEKVLEQVTTGQIPPDAMSLLEVLSREFASAALTNELKMGQLPGRTVKATEIVELQQSQQGILDALIGDMERSLIAPLLRKAWLVLVQNLNQVPAHRVLGAIGPEATFRLTAIREADKRYAMVARQSNLKVRGLSTMLAKVRDFQKITALLQLVTTNPVMMQAFFTQNDPRALLAYMMKTLQLDPSEFERAAQELPRSPEQDMAQMPQFQALAAPGASQPNMGGPGTAGSPMAADINQAANPMTGISGTA